MMEHENRRRSAPKQWTVRRLEECFEEIEDFEQPKIALEQYATPPHIAALVINAIDSTYGDFHGKLVADLGCGTGRLTVGSILCGAEQVYGIDIDQSAIQLASQNMISVFSEEEDSLIDAYRACGQFNFILADIASCEYDRFWLPFNNLFDTVMMNPPFGTKNNRGLDMVFLKRGIEISKNTVYSLHKTSTREVSI